MNLDIAQRPLKKGCFTLSLSPRAKARDDDRSILSTRCRFRRSTKRYPYRHYRSWIIVRKRARLLKSQYVFFISLNSTFERGMSATKDDYKEWIVFFLVFIGIF